MCDGHPHRSPGSRSARGGSHGGPREFCRRSCSCGDGAGGVKEGKGRFTFPPGPKQEGPQGGRGLTQVEPRVVQERVGVGLRCCHAVWRDEGVTQRWEAWVGRVGIPSILIRHRGAPDDGPGVLGGGHAVLEPGGGGRASPRRLAPQPHHVPQLRPPGCRGPLARQGQARIPLLRQRGPVPDADGPRGRGAPTGAKGPSGCWAPRAKRPDAGRRRDGRDQEEEMPKLQGVDAGEERRHPAAGWGGGKTEPYLRRPS